MVTEMPYPVQPLAPSTAGANGSSHETPDQPLQRSLSRQAITRLNSIRRDRKRSPQRPWDDPRPDSATLNDAPRIMSPARAYTLARTRNHNTRVNNNRRLSPFPSVRPQQKLSKPQTPKHSPYLISNPIGPPYYPAADQFGGSLHSKSVSCSTTTTTYSGATVMHPETTPYARADWMSKFRVGLRLAVVALSAAVVGLLLNTLQIYRGNNNLDLRKGEMPMPWPARTNMVPTALLLTVAAVNFLASFIVLVLSLRRSFQTPLGSRDVSRVVAGGLSITFWVSALLVYGIVNHASKASLGQYACKNRDSLTNGRYQYRTVCNEQVRISSTRIYHSFDHCSNSLIKAAAFYIAIAAAFAETLTLVSLLMSSLQQARHERQNPQDQEKPLLKAGTRF